MTLLTDSRLAGPHAALMALCAQVTAMCEEAELLNDPLTRGGGGTRSSSKPEGKEPGHQQAEWLVEKDAEILRGAVKSMAKAHRGLKLRDPLTYSEAERLRERREQKAQRDAELERIAQETSQKRHEVHISVVDGALRARRELTRNTGGLRRGDKACGE